VGWGEQLDGGLLLAKASVLVRVGMVEGDDREESEGEGALGSLGVVV
jgi:hypothetical protein